ncbi:unnamed protein product, partial [Effrenium voratum]
ENFKTVLCKFYEQGYCKMDTRCTFAHGRNQLRVPTAKESRPESRPESRSFVLNTIAFRQRRSMAVDIRPVQKKHHLCRSCLVKCTLRKGVPFPRMGHRESYGKDGAWTYVYFPAEFKEFQEDVAHFITLTGDAAEPRWFFVVDHVALKTSELSLPILQAGFDWTTSNQRAFEHIMHDVKETLFGQYFDEDVEDDVNILKFLTVQLDSKLKDYYFNGDDAKRYNRQLAHIRLAGQKSLLIQLVERDLW